MKVAIIGAGICGLYLAWKLAERGEDVTVFEKKKKIGKEACSGLFSERILDYIPESKSLIENQIEFIIINFPKRRVKVSFSKNFFTISHFELDNLVADLAQKAGAKIILNSYVTSLPSDFDKIIGCDGANSMVRKNLEFPEPKYRLAMQGFVKKQNHSNFIETWAVNKGFIWKIPKKQDIEYGIIAEPKQCRLLFQKFLTKNEPQGVHFRVRSEAQASKLTWASLASLENKIKLEKVNSALVSQGFFMPSNPSVTLCGESAGLTKSWSGGGVIWGLKSCELLLKHFPDFPAHQKAMKRFFVPEIIFSKFITKLIYFLGFNLPWVLPSEVNIEGDFMLKYHNAK